ncbi:MAG: hypothetical protein F9K32_19215 [Desulfobulbaceae bacterium]|nr:MAG: hypothetical protein F9K32_19215 [Desulfobulbaceae bacterium]
MEITGSQLRMEAITGHKEVQFAGGRTTISSLPAISEKQKFSLNLDDGRTGSSAVKETVKRNGIQPDEVRRARHSNRIIEDLGAAVLGRRIRVRQSTQAGALAANLRAAVRPAVPRPFNARFSGVAVSQETDFIDFRSNGSITTGDGRKIEFAMNLSVSRTSTTVSLAESSFPWLIDPLVLSFDDGLDSLDQTSFLFDLDGDGTEEEISGLRAGSGFLALDHNEDGTVNDGLELFGPLTGSGFGELSNYDDDDNGWLDIRDPAFDQLMVWMNAGGDNERLVSLREAGVGALSLSALSTDFVMKQSDGTVMGEIARAGLFFMENGEVHSMQEIDLAARQHASPANDGDAERRSVAADWSRAASSSSPRLDTIEDAIMALQQLIIRQRNQMMSFTLRALVPEEKKESLHERFWRWQEEDDQTRLA